MKTRKLIIYTAVLAALLASLCGCEHLHDYAEGKMTREPTCVSEGIREDICECGEVTEVAIPAKGHTDGEWQTVLAPTCTDDGSEELICAKCGEVIETRAIPATGHDLVLWEAEKPTCTRMGWDAFEICTLCDHSTYKAVPMTDHTPGAAATCDKAQTCTECGTVLTEALGHTLTVEKGLSPNCVREGKSDRVTCGLCGLLIQESIPLPLAAHRIETVDGVEPTCSEEGISEGQYCFFCDKVIVDAIEIPATEHSYSGIKDRECDDCGAKRDLVCEHTVTERIKRVGASCTNYGLTSGEVCTYCGFVLKRQELIEAKDHDFKKLEGFAPTATTPGLTDGVYCSTCNNIFKSQELIPPIGGNSPEGYDGSFHEDFNGGKLSYAVNPGGTTCTVVGIGSCTSPRIVIPAEIDGYTVTDVGSHAFWREAVLGYVYISDSVTAVGERAFSECPALQKIELSDGTALGNKVFFGSSSAHISFRHSTVYIQSSKGNCYEPAVKEHFLCQNCGGCFADVGAKEPMYEVTGTTVHDFESGTCIICGLTRRNLKAIGVISPERIAPVPIGTLTASLGLPSTVDVKTADLAVHKAKVVWDTSNYDPLTAGFYTLVGYAELGRFTPAVGISNRVTLTVEVTDKATDMLDVILVLDTTSSMADKLSEVNAGMSKLIDNLKEAGIAPRLGLVEFKSAIGTSKIIYNGASPWCDSVARFRSALAGLNAASSEQTPSATPIDALMLAAENMEDRQGVKKVCIIISDGYCILANSHAFTSLQQAVDVLNGKSIYTAVMVPKDGYPLGYDSLLKREKCLSFDIGAGIEEKLETDFTEWILSISE